MTLHARLRQYVTPSPAPRCALATAATAHGESTDLYVRPPLPAPRTPDADPRRPNARSTELRPSSRWLVPRCSSCSHGLLVRLRRSNWVEARATAHDGRRTRHCVRCNSRSFVVGRPCDSSRPTSAKTARCSVAVATGSRRNDLADEASLQHAMPAPRRHGAIGRKPSRCWPPCCLAGLRQTGWRGSNERRTAMDTHSTSVGLLLHLLDLGEHRASLGDEVDGGHAHAADLSGAMARMSRGQSVSRFGDGDLINQRGQRQAGAAAGADAPSAAPHPGRLRS